MILYKGKLLENETQANMLKSLKDDCYQTLKNGLKIDPMVVIEACDKLAKKVRNGEYNSIVTPLLNAFDIPYDYFVQSISMFEKEALIHKCRVELGEDFLSPKDLNDQTKRRIYPLGILFHIAAGNVDALPAYSVIEGLLAGNINILKLPSGDVGVSVKLLHELIQIEPKLTEFIYVFDVPSTEVESIKALAEIADGIVVWGGDVAVKAAYQMASVTQKIIPWGHKLSFAYATPNCTDDDLEALVHHICETNQVLCSSAQGVFLDTNDLEVLNTFSDRFYHIFDRVSKTHKEVPIGMRGRNNIELYYESLIQKETEKRILKGKGFSVVTSKDNELTLSMLFRNVWVKRLPRDEIITNLKPHKNHLQTVALMCLDKDLDELSNRLASAGLVRITKPIDMSRMNVGEAHDGTYALREYTRIVEIRK